jgi:hypothetical protein
MHQACSACAYFSRGTLKRLLCRHPRARRRAAGPPAACACPEGISRIAAAPLALHAAPTWPRSLAWIARRSRPAGQPRYAEPAQSLVMHIMHNSGNLSAHRSRISSPRRSHRLFKLARNRPLTQRTSAVLPLTYVSGRNCPFFITSKARIGASPMCFGFSVGVRPLPIFLVGVTISVQRAPPPAPSHEEPSRRRA